MLTVDDLGPVKADVLVMDSQLLSFNLLVGMDIIKMLRWIE